METSPWLYGAFTKPTMLIYVQVKAGTFFANSALLLSNTMWALRAKIISWAPKNVKESKLLCCLCFQLGDIPEFRMVVYHTEQCRKASSRERGYPRLDQRYFHLQVNILNLKYSNQNFVNASYIRQKIQICKLVIASFCQANNVIQVYK